MMRDNNKLIGALMRGADLRTIQELMGHDSSSMTLEYARSSEEAKR